MQQTSTTLALVDLCSAELRQLASEVKNMLAAQQANNVCYLISELQAKRRQKKSTLVNFFALVAEAKHVPVRDLHPVIRAWVALCKIDRNAISDFASKVVFWPWHGEEIIIGLVHLYRREKCERSQKKIRRLITEACYNWINCEV